MRIALTRPAALTPWGSRSTANLGRQPLRRGKGDFRHGPIPVSVVARDPSMRFAVGTLGRKAPALGFRLRAGHRRRLRIECWFRIYPPAAHGGTFCQLAGRGSSAVTGRSSPRVSVPAGSGDGGSPIFTTDQFPLPSSWGTHRCV